jgi:hypothetical protein
MYPALTKDLLENKTCGKENVDQLIFTHQEKKMIPGLSEIRHRKLGNCLITGKNSKESKISECYQNDRLRGESN